METVSLILTGKSDLLQHNVRLVDPLNEHTQALAALTSKRKKTKETHAKIGRVEFEGGMYFDDDAGPYVPGRWIHKAIRDAAALKRDGKKIERGVMVADEIVKIAYKGPRTVEGLWKGKHYDRRAVGVGQKRVMRTRPRFSGWRLAVGLLYAPTIIDLETLWDSVVTAGLFIGLGDARRLGFGRFEVAEA